LRLRSRLTLLIAVAALVPLLFTAFAATRIADSYNLSQSKELYSKRADALALYTLTWFDSHLKGLSMAARLFDVDSLSPEEQEGLLHFAYRQFNSVNVALVVDIQGQVVSGPVRATQLSEIKGGLLDGHEIVSEERLQAFLNRVVLFGNANDSAQTAVGAPYSPPGADHKVVPISIRGLGGSGQVVAVELSLATLGPQFEIQGSGGVAAVLVGQDGVLVGQGSALVNPETTALFSEGLAGHLEYELPDETVVLAAFASVANYPWRVVVAVPRSIATAAGREIQARVWFMYLLAIILAGALGILGARQIERPVVRLKKAAFQVAEGELGLRVEPEGVSEVADLAKAFNFMSRRLAQDKKEIAEKNAEIQAFNEELQARVEERTRDLEESQRRLVKSSRMAAVAQMGAGLAHELNNPIAGVLGLAQVAQMKGGAEPAALASIEEQAQRCRTIIATLSRFTTGERGRKARTDLAELCAQVVELSAGPFSDAGVRLENKVSGPVWAHLDGPFLGQALAQLLKSLRAELEPTGVLRLELLADPESIRLIVSLHGELRPQGDDWLATGMGFWVARYAVQEHGGRFEESQAPNRLVQLILPKENA
jgi:two-component system NtrC family sensor kinase